MATALRKSLSNIAAGYRRDKRSEPDRENTVERFLEEEDPLEDPPTNASSTKREKKPVTPAALQRWNEDIEHMELAIKLMLGNELSEADVLMQEWTAEISTRTFDWEGGDHDLRGGFRFVHSIFALLDGIASLQKDQFDEVLTKIWAADELLIEDHDWAGKTVLRGMCILMAGIVQVLQGSYTKGVWNALRSWKFLRHLEKDGLNFEGHERSCVRSTSLFGLGIFNLFASILPPQAMKGASWITGFKGGREVALNQLLTCYDEGGIQRWFTGLVYIGYAVDLSNFLGEFASMRGERMKHARRILDAAKEVHPNSFFFAGSESNYQVALRDIDAGIAKLREIEPVVTDKPMFVFLIQVRLASLHLMKLEFSDAAIAYRAAAEIYRKAERRAFCPTLLMNEYCCHRLADNEEAAAAALSACATYKQEKKKWNGLDVDSLDKCEKSLRVLNGKSVNEEDRWDFKKHMLLKLILIYRGGYFMSPTQFDNFMAFCKREIDAGGENADARLFYIFLEAEAMRQMERWDEALELINEYNTLLPKASPSKSHKKAQLDSQPFMYLVSAYANYAKGKATAAQDALTKLEKYRKDYMFARALQFKTAHLRELLGMEFQDAYSEFTVAARSKTSLSCEIGGDVDTLECDWLVKDKTVTFTAFFLPRGDKAKAFEIRKDELWDAKSGPCEFSFDVPGPGLLRLCFDNSFSRMTGKHIRLRVQPDSLALKQD